MSVWDDLEGRQLHELTTAEAAEVLQRFLHLESERFKTLSASDPSLDFSRESVRSVLLQAVEESKAGQLANAEFARLGYYLGQALRRVSGNLRWATGERTGAFDNHPVIAGFSDGMEAPVITVCRNIVRSVSEGLSPASRIDKAVDAWFDDAQR